MAEIQRYLFANHLRSESSAHILHYSGGRLQRSGRGLSFWFLPWTASLAEIPMDDRELALLFHGRSLDFQDLSCEAVVTWRVRDAEGIAQRIDFTIDLAKGLWLRQPMEKVATMLTQFAQQCAWGYFTRTPLEKILREGVDEVRQRVSQGMTQDPMLMALGIDVVSVRVAALRPSSDIEKALQTPVRESLQQESDRATFERRAMAVERERAIAENELKNRIELARREEELIAQKGQNERRRISDEVEAQKLQVAAAADKAKIEAATKAEGIRIVEAANAEAEQARMAIYSNLPDGVILELAARDLAQNLPDIEHLNLSPDLLGPLLGRLLEASTKKLEKT